MKYNYTEILKKADFDEYDLVKLIEKAVTERTEEAIFTLAAWFEKYDKYSHFWDGEGYFFNYAGREWELTPIYEEIEEDEFEIVSWDLD